jgi:hypothetical protein
MARTAEVELDGWAMMGIQSWLSLSAGESARVSGFSGWFGHRTRQGWRVVSFGMSRSGKAGGWPLPFFILAHPGCNFLSNSYEAQAYWALAVDRSCALVTDVVYRRWIEVTGPSRGLHPPDPRTRPVKRLSKSFPCSLSSLR